MYKFSFMKKHTIIQNAALAMVITLLCGIVYVSVQQSYRMSANDPQLQFARDLSLHQSARQNAFFNDTVDIANSLAVFSVFYDRNGQPVKGSGFLDGKLPQLPPGVFDFANRKGEDAVTWQLRHGVRAAMVIERVSTPDAGFVAVGRSLKEVEIRESNLGKIVFLGWLACMGILVLNLVWQGYSNANR